MGLRAKLQSWSQELTPYFIYLLLTATLGPMLFGYHLAELNAPSQVLRCAKKSLTTTTTKTTATSGLPQCIPMTPAEFGLVSSTFTLGGLFGALAAGPLSARYGRLRVMRLNTSMMVLGPVAEALAPSIAILSVGRFISGLGAGVAVVVVPIYISEIAPPAEKGFFGAFTQIMTNMGIFVAQLLGYFLSHDAMWRVILAVAGGIGALQFFGLGFAMDSPVWNAKHGKLREAREDLKRIRGRGAVVEDEMASWGVVKDGENLEEEEQTLLPTTDPESQHRGSQTSASASAAATTPAANANDSFTILTVLTHRDTRPAILAVILVMLAQQLTGINSIIMYGVELLADLLAANSALLNIFVSILNVVATTSFAPLADTLGRKTVLLASIAGMGASSLLLALGIRGGVPLLSAIAVLAFVASFAFGLGPVPFILASELVGPDAVGATQSWALAANWISTFVVAQFFPVLNQSLGKGVVYFIFAAAAVVFIMLVAVFVPETKGKKNADEVWGRPPRRED